MYLKALEIQGFKSFPDKTRLTFEKDITAIVGPNGSGKSNISDAILWVMGEQRTKTLRGGKMEDVIFGGTEKRNALGFAQVSLIIDNSAGIFKVDNYEVMITRRYYRSGESEYYINRETMRLKDITELLMDTGLGRDGYSIIGQGKIADIVSAKSHDRRDIFEEAAGISRFRHRKEESERKLERTDENLLRVSDKIDELELQVDPLREQAETAKKYLIFRDELRVLEVSYWLENLDRLRASSTAVAGDCDVARQNLEQAHAELETLYADAENISQKMRECELETESARMHLSEAEGTTAECDSAVAVLRANLKNNYDSIERIKAELNEQQGRTRSLEEQISERKLRIETIDEERALLDAEMRGVLRRTQENSDKTDARQREIDSLVANEAELTDVLTQNKTMLTVLADSAQELLDRDAASAVSQAELVERLDKAKADLNAARAELSKAKDTADELSNVIAGYKMRMADREEKVRKLSIITTRITIDARSADARITMLGDMERDFEGYSKAVKLVMLEARRGSLSGVHGPVANLIKADDRFALALETALGAAMQNIIVDTQDCGRIAIEMLKSRDAGRATFLPIDVVRGSSLSKLPTGERGYCGTALELAQFDKRYHEIFSNLLGRTVVVESLSDAVRISHRFDNKLRIVTLDGQLMNAGGSMTGGSAARNSGIISRANELKRLRVQRDKLRADEEQFAVELAEAERELNAAKYEMDVATTEYAAAREALMQCDTDAAQCRITANALNDALEARETERVAIAAKIEENGNEIARSRINTAEHEAKLSDLRSELDELAKGREEIERRRHELSEELSEIRAKSASLDAEREASNAAMSQLDELRCDISGGADTRQKAIDDIDDHNRDLQDELQEKELRQGELSDKVTSIKERISKITTKKLELEGLRTQREKSAQAKNRDLLDLERVSARLEQKKLAADMEEKQIVDRLWDTYELSHSAAQAARQPIESMQKTQRRVSELKREISSLGNPNLGAIDEYDRVSARYEFLTEQRDDVQKAKSELQKIISEITVEMKDIFVREFRAIDESFRKTFLELFGGGKAALILEDEEDVLGCGIEIKVQPPGKALSTISLMSGGEKAFVAIALYFAILKVRPTPFCVMDEIEAALDESNVIRFAEYMRSMSFSTQFIVITHRRGTMEEADMLYGVTMQEKGVSRVISVNLNEAEKTIA